MAVRTSAAAVSEIIEVESSIDLTPFIEVANALVSELCVDSGYDAARLELIERWLSAHFYAVRDPRRASESAGPVGERFQYKIDLNLSVTTYGQQAMMIDTAGNLKMLSKGTKAVPISAFWMGS